MPIGLLKRTHFTVVELFFFLLLRLLLIIIIIIVVTQWHNFQRLPWKFGEVMKSQI
jgi:hypothetical protein